METMAFGALVRVWCAGKSSARAGFNFVGQLTKSWNYRESASWFGHKMGRGGESRKYQPLDPEDQRLM
jgi:hypothetical protein